MSTSVVARSPADRILSLDVIRGVAVMGIFSVNIVGMAMIQIAYFYPPAYGFHSLSDRLMWLVNFLLIDGKMRALFSMLFGASSLLVIDRAVAAGRSGWKTHYARMIVLLGFGYLHFLVLWWGDILTHYAAVGMVLFLFHKLKPRTLLIVAACGFVSFAGLSGFGVWKAGTAIEHIQAGTATPDEKKMIEKGLASIHPSAKDLAEDRAEHATIPAHFRAAEKEMPAGPLDFGPLFVETLSLMLLGMAAYKSGFLTGEWSAKRYRKVAAIGLGIGFVVYGALAARDWGSGFAPLQSFPASGGWSPCFRPLMASGWAALFILAMRPGGWLTTRFAAVGRTAFSNYLGCTIIGTLLMYGFGANLYGTLSRSQAWLIVPPVWLAMLAWSKPWLDRFHYGPFEWLWRSLSRGKLQPMRKKSSLPQVGRGTASTAGGGGA